MALVAKIRLEGTETTTARDLLGNVISEALATAPPSFTCKKQKYGSLEEFQTAPAEWVSRPVTKNQPRYFLVGKQRGPNDRMTMHQQNQLCAAIQGKKAARIKDNNAVNWREAGWKDWGEEQ